MAVLYIQKECLLILFCGLYLVCCAHPVDHTVIYTGQTEVLEGDSLEISCIMSERDLHEWTLNSSFTIEEDNVKGYALLEKPAKTFYDKYVLEIQSAQLYHEGEYRCNKYSRDFHYLNVIPISSDDLEKDDKEDQPIVKRSNEHILKINETIEFYCASARDDNSQVTWYKNSRRILENSDSNVIIPGLNLIIQDAQEDDAGEYMCTVDTPYVTGYTDIGRIFRLNSPANIFDFPEKMSVIQGRTLKLNCKARGFPQPKIIWYIGNIIASQLKESDLRITIYSLADGGQVNSFLAIRDVSDEDSSLYTCRAENSIDSGLSIVYDEESVFVHVRENMIEPNEDEPGMGKLLIPGERLVLQCNTSECPHCTVVWFKDDKLLEPIPGHLEIYEKNNSVLIEQSSYNDSGVYICAIDRKQLDVALNATIVVQSKIKLEKFEQSSIVVQGSPLELYCLAKGAPMPHIKWFIGDKEVDDDNERIKLLDHEGLKKGKLLIEEADFQDRNYYTCEAYNQIDSVNATIFIRIKDKLAALWPFLGICAEVVILCSIIFVYERRKSMTQCDEPDTDLPTDNKHHRDQKLKGQDVRQRK